MVIYSERDNFMPFMISVFRQTLDCVCDCDYYIYVYSTIPHAFKRRNRTE